MATKSKETAIGENPIRIIQYFIVENGKYRRVFAKLTALQAHALTIWINKDFTLESDYNLLDLRVDDMLLAFAYKKKGEKYAKLYPLPLEDVSRFTEDAADTHYPLLTDEQMTALEEKDKDVKSKKELIVQLQNQIKKAYRENNEQQYAQVNFARSLPVSRRVQNLSAVNCTKKTASVPHESPVVDQTPTEKASTKHVLKLKNKKSKEFAKKLFDVKFHDQEGDS